MARGFSAQESFEARDSGESIMLGMLASKELLEDHGCTIGEYMADNGMECGRGFEVDSAEILAWLGY